MKAGRAIDQSPLSDCLNGIDAKCLWASGLWTKQLSKVPAQALRPNDWNVLSSQSPESDSLRLVFHVESVSLLFFFFLGNQLWELSEIEINIYCQLRPTFLVFSDNFCCGLASLLGYLNSWTFTQGLHGVKVLRWKSLRSSVLNECVSIS